MNHIELFMIHSLNLHVCAYPWLDLAELLMLPSMVDWYIVDLEWHVLLIPKFFIHVAKHVVLIHVVHPG